MRACISSKVFGICKVVPKKAMSRSARALARSVYAGLSEVADSSFQGFQALPSQRDFITDSHAFALSPKNLP